MATTASLIKQMAEILGISERQIRGELVELGLGEVLSEARRLQASVAFDEKRLVTPGEPITPEQLREAYKLVTEGEG